MEFTARVLNDGRVIVPDGVLSALGVNEGDSLHYRLEGQQVILTRVPDFLSLAGAIPVPPERRGAVWSEVVADTRASRSSRRR